MHFVFADFPWAEDTMMYFFVYKGLLLVSASFERQREQDVGKSLGMVAFYVLGTGGGRTNIGDCIAARLLEPSLLPFPIGNGLTGHDRSQYPHKLISQPEARVVIQRCWFVWRILQTIKGECANIEPHYASLPTTNVRWGLEKCLLSQQRPRNPPEGHGPSSVLGALFAIAD